MNVRKTIRCQPSRTLISIGILAHLTIIQGCLRNKPKDDAASTQTLHNKSSVCDTENRTLRRNTKQDGSTNVPMRLGPAKSSNTRPSNSTVVKWITVPGGVFMMGSTTGYSDERPVHKVRLRSFQLSKTEVTVAQYRKCVMSRYCTKPFSGSFCNWSKSGREDHPVNCVDWFQARRFAKWVGGRLPTESEWEYAARSGGRNWKYPWGNSRASCKYAIIDEGCDSKCDFKAGCGKDRTWSVCSRIAGNTVHGLCDMSGNVWEWTEDWYHTSYSGAPGNGRAVTASPKGDTPLRAARGGSWSSGNDINIASKLPPTPRCADRYGYGPKERVPQLGFRVARSKISK